MNLIIFVLHVIFCVTVTKSENITAEYIEDAKLTAKCDFLLCSLQPLQMFLLNIFNTTVNVLILTETWLKAEHLDSEILNSDWQIFRCDRYLKEGEDRGGGVLIAVHISLSALPITINVNNFDYNLSQQIWSQLILKYGYPAQEHHVRTSDGYILTMHRIARPKAPPILLQHGLLDSSATYILFGPNISLGYLLYDIGYDVWIGNARGNRYSRKHISLDPEDKDFWNFSWHEMGLYDLPAMIDYILDQTKFEKLFYVGHSQGVTSFLVMCSKLPDYNKKINVMMAMGPAVYLGNVPGPLVRMVVDYLGPVEAGFNYLKVYELIVPNELVKNTCEVKNPMQQTCLNMYSIIMGPNPDQVDLKLMPLIGGHMPAGSSVKQVIHYGQLVRSFRFCEYDFGTMSNMVKYGKPIPPKYDLAKVTAPVIIFYGSNDYLLAQEDINQLYRELGNVIGKYRLETYNHMDFLWAKGVRLTFYNRFVRILDDFRNGNLTKVEE